MLRKCTAQEDGTGVPATALAYQKDDILPALQACLNLAEVVFVVDGLLVDLKDHVTATQAGIFGERVRLHVLHDDPFTRLRSEAICEVTRQRPHRYAQLA